MIYPLLRPGEVIYIQGRLSDFDKDQNELLTLDPKEKKDLLQCLKYCLHRVHKHISAGIHKTGIDCEWLKETIANLEAP